MLRRSFCTYIPKQTDRGNPFGKYGLLDVANVPPAPRELINKFRLENQKHIKKEDATLAPSERRQRQHMLCQKCGTMKLTINFDKAPSARIGMFGVCVGGTDYTHHRFHVLTSDQYRLLGPLPPNERLKWFMDNR